MQISHVGPRVMSNLTGRAEIETMSADLKLKYGVLESALSMVFCLLFFLPFFAILLLLLWSYQLLTKFNVNVYKDAG